MSKEPTAVEIKIARETPLTLESVCKIFDILGPRAESFIPACLRSGRHPLCVAEAAFTYE